MQRRERRTDRPEDRRLPAILFLVAAVLMAGALALVIAGRYVLAVESYAQERYNDARDRTEALAVTQEALVHAKLDELDRMIKWLRALLEGPWRDSESLYHTKTLMRSVLEYNPLVMGFEVLTAEEETLIRIYQDECRPSAHYTPFAVFQADHTDNAHLSEPFPGKPPLPGRCITLSRPLLDESGSLAGAVTAVISATLFGEAVGAVNELAGMTVGVFTPSGNPVFRTPPSPEGPRSITALELRESSESGPAVSFLTDSPFDGKRRVVTVRRFERRALTVVVSEDFAHTAEAIATYRRAERKRSVLTAVPLYGLLAMIGVLSARQIRATKTLEAGFIERSNIVEELRAGEQRLRHMAQHDSLTGLPNRVLFADRTHQALGIAERSGERVAIMFIDLDGFKPVNDSYGHAAGDDVLTEISERMVNVVRASDTVGRMGGDEFLVLLPVVEDAEAALEVARKLSHEVSRPVSVEGERVVITASIGLAIYPEHAATSTELAANADRAMYAAKRAGGNTIELFENETE